MIFDAENYSKEELQLVKDYKEVFNSETGKKVLEDLSSKFDLPSYVKGDINATIYREGRRAVLLHIKNYVEGVING